MPGIHSVISKHVCSASYQYAFMVLWILNERALYLYSKGAALTIIPWDAVTGEADRM